jgi:hypothetical protein
MARPLHAQEPEKPKTGPEKIIKMVERGPQDDSDGLPPWGYEDPSVDSDWLGFGEEPW